MKKKNPATVATLTVTKKDLLRELADREEARLGLTKTASKRRTTGKQVDKNADVDWTKVKTKCPKKGCGHVGFVIPDFGVRKVRGNTYKHSFCTACRGDKKYYKGVRSA